MNGYCAYCNKPLLTGDFNGICRFCRENGNSEFNSTPSNYYATTNMITHEEVRKELGDKVIFSTIPITMNYLKQQQAKDERAKKVEELLELYRKHMNTLCKNAREGVKDSMFSSEFVAYKLYQQIQALEEELK